jgi:hypothetical protein
LVLPGAIPTKDLIIQEAMRILLEVIFEGKKSSDGISPFVGKTRPLGRSCHTALKEVSNWNGIT